jgi:hypothetical protein
VGEADHPAVSYAWGALESSGKQRTRKSLGRVYRIVVRGELSRRYAGAFEGMEMETETGRTTLTGVIDQPGLHGIFERINGLGLELLSVESSPEKTTEQAGSGGGGTAAMCTGSGQPERRTTLDLFGYFHPVVDLFGYFHPVRRELRA